MERNEENEYLRSFNTRQGSGASHDPYDACGVVRLVSPYGHVP